MKFIVKGEYGYLMTFNAQTGSTWTENHQAATLFDEDKKEDILSKYPKSSLIEVIKSKL